MIKNKYNITHTSYKIINHKNKIINYRTAKNLEFRNLINSCAHITGGGLIENIARSIPDNLSLNIDLAKIKTTKIFKWLKNKNISDEEMLKTFNCGVGFCIIVPKKNINKIKRFFSKQFMPYEIGRISKEKKRINISNSIRW